MKNDNQKRSATDTMQNAMAMHQQGRRKNADRLYAEVLELEPRHARALRLRGILAREMDNLTASIELLQKAVAAAPEDPEPLCELALSQMIVGEFDLAENTFRQALVCNPDSLKALTNLGALLQYCGHDKQAIDLHRRALELDSDDIEVRCNLAKCLMEVGRADAAIVECDSAIALSDGHPMTLATKGVVFCDMGEFEKAKDSLSEAISKNPEDDMVWVNLGFAIAELGQPEAAVDALRRALEINPQNARAAADSSYLLTKMNRSNEAVALSDKFLQRHPGETPVLAAYAFALRNAGQDADSDSLLDFDKLIRSSDLKIPLSYDSLAVFNNELADIIENNSSLTENPFSKSTLGGAQTGELDLNSHQALSTLRHSINDAVADAMRDYRESGLTDHPIMTRATESWTLRLWGTVIYEHGYQASHIHPMSWLSGVYYVRLPSDMSRLGSQDGWIEFGAPPERLVGPYESEIHRLEPREGRLILFPAWFHHRTSPFSADGLRISIAFDVMPKAGIRYFQKFAN